MQASRAALQEALTKMDQKDMAAATALLQQSVAALNASEKQLLESVAPMAELASVQYTWGSKPFQVGVRLNSCCASRV